MNQNAACYVQLIDAVPGCVAQSIDAPPAFIVQLNNAQPAFIAHPKNAHGDYAVSWLLRCSVVTVLLILLAGCSNSSAPNTLLGTVEWDRVELSVEASERITEILVREGDRVAADQQLVTLDAERAQSEVEAAQSEVHRFEAIHDELVQGPRNETLLEAKARVARAQATLHGAYLDADRAQQMRARKLNSQADFDRSQTQLHAAQADIAAAKASLLALQNGTRPETLRQSNAAVASAQARLHSAQINLQRLQITAPRAGWIEALPFEVGDKPAPAASIVVMRVGNAPFARVYVPQPLRVGLKVGDQFQINLSDGSHSFNGSLRWVSSDAVFTPYYALHGDDANRLSYLAEIDLQGEGVENLPAGISITAKLVERD